MFFSFCESHCADQSSLQQCVTFGRVVLFGLEKIQSGILSGERRAQSARAASVAKTQAFGHHPLVQIGRDHRAEQVGLSVTTTTIISSRLH